MVDFGAITRAAEGGIGADVRARGRPKAACCRILPLAHSFERSWVEAAALVDGRTRIFFTESLETFQADLQRAADAVHLVPRLWLKFQQGVFSKMPPKKLDFLLSHPIVGRMAGEEGARRAGLDEGRQRR